MKYRPPSMQTEESARQRLITELQSKIDRQAAEIQDWKKKNEQLLQEKDDLRIDYEAHQRSSLQTRNKPEKSRDQGMEDRCIPRLLKARFRCAGASSWHA